MTTAYLLLRRRDAGYHYPLGTIREPLTINKMNPIRKLWQWGKRKIIKYINLESSKNNEQRKMDLDDLPEIEFDIDKDSTELKDLVSIYESQFFLADIARLATMQANPRIDLQPFTGLSSPFRQLAHIGALNVTSESALISKKEVEENTEEWKDLVVQAIKVRGGYYGEMMPKEGEVSEEYYELYKISLPVFDSHFDTTTVNFEEQEINKIRDLFVPFDSVIESKTGLKTNDFIEIFNTIDYTISANIKESYNLFVRSQAVQKEKLKNKKTHPKNWNYKGRDQEVLRLIEYHTDPRIKLTPDMEVLERHIPKKKLQLFFDLFTINRGESPTYKYYTEVNPLLQKPIYQYADRKYLIVFHQHLIHSIFRFLYEIVTQSNKQEKFFIHRGKWLQTKTVEILETYFGNKAKIYNEYKVDGKGQDVLLLKSGLALIIENKAHNEVRFSGVPDVRTIFELYLSRFKKSIQKGYDQCWRVKKNFLQREKFEITNNRGKNAEEIKTKDFPNVFSIVLTMEEFRTPQINTPDLLSLENGDNNYPLSICIDDFEVVLLTLKKMNKGIEDLIKYLKLRERMQGKLKSPEELSIWASFIMNSEFVIPTEEGRVFYPGPKALEVFNHQYEAGLGFRDEKYLRMKKRDTFKYLNAMRNRLTVPNKV